MYSHMMVGSNDKEKARTFYDAVFKAIGAEPGIIDPKGRLVYMHNGAAFLVDEPLDGNPASPGNGMTIGFLIDDNAKVDAWHAAGVANGGTAIEDPPGWRYAGERKAYVAYLRDPDNNKLCAICR